MRHNNKINHLGRTYSHRAAMLSNMAVSLIKHKRIFTTLPKAKELRKYVEPLISKSKNDTTHSRRLVFQELRDKYAVTELFQEVSQKIGDRPGGYTRIIKTGNRLGDNASTCFIELVDYNELMLKDTKKVTTKTRRSRRGSGKATAQAEESITATPKVAKPAEEIKAEVPVVEEAITETPAVETPVVEEVAEIATELPAVEETPETPTEETPKAE
ncbi:50S ribosomal protein L17 [Bacteroidia bacterium]|nr:50S ribosomal protein L17 [Bacteroidia bacterium]